MSVPSPCISVCRMSVSLAQRCGDAVAASAQGVCEGCFRSMDEIIAWGTLPDAQRLVVWNRLGERARAAGCEAPAMTSQHPSRSSA